jgi:hypothetical protein
MPHFTGDEAPQPPVRDENQPQVERDGTGTVPGTLNFGSIQGDQGPGECVLLH